MNIFKAELKISEVNVDQLRISHVSVIISHLNSREKPEVTPGSVGGCHPTQRTELHEAIKQMPISEAVE